MLNFQGAVYQDSVLLTHAPPLGWVSFPRKTWVSFNYKSIYADGYTQLNLFNEAEQEADPNVLEPDLEEVHPAFYRSFLYNLSIGNPKKGG